MNSLWIHSVVLVAGIVAGAILYIYAPRLAHTASTEAPINFVAVSERIHTSGQPSAAQLGGLDEKGYALVINLAPPTSMGSLAEEGMLVAQRGIAYVNIPVDWHSPQYEDFALFSKILGHANSRRVLVHCQINKRASLFTFLHQVVHAGVSPQLAYENVTAVWVPDAQWKAFAQAVLNQHKVAFEPF
jgi:protein tyrosine phosphatase (PTP) superfamily phosphohydrolase (DUF442 family)